MSVGTHRTPRLKRAAWTLPLGTLLAGASPAGASHSPEVMEVAGDCEGGSSNATGYASNKRLVMTRSGRELGPSCVPAVTTGPGRGATKSSSAGEERTSGASASGEGRPRGLPG